MGLPDEVLDAFKGFTDDEVAPPPPPTVMPSKPSVQLTLGTLPPAALDPTVADTKPFGAHQFGDLALQLVLNARPVDDLLADFNLTHEQFGVLLDNPVFVAAIEESKRLIASYGRDAGFRIRARAVAEDLVGKVYNDALLQTTDPALRHKILITMAAFAGYSDKPTAEQQGPTGMSVTINVGSGVRGVSGEAITVEAKPVTLPEGVRGA